MTIIMIPMNAPENELSVRRKTGMAESTIRQLVRAGKFPKPVKRGRSSFWVESEVDEYLLGLIEARDRDAA